MKTFPKYLVILFTFITVINLLSAQEISTIADIYDFEVGDEFHYEDHYFSFMGSHWEKIHETILSKYYSDDLDTLFYMVNQETAGLYSWDPDVWHYYTNIWTEFYTNLDSLILDGEIDTVFSNLEQYNGRKINMVDSFNDTLKYVDGCGLTHWYYYEPQWSITSNYVLKYYKKGDEVWGSPILIQGINSKESFNVKLFPNPTSGILQIDLRSCNKRFDHFEVYDVNGAISKQNKISPTSLNYLDISNLDKGTYFIKLISRNYITIRKIIKN